jgi:hypothetical protein
MLVRTMLQVPVLLAVALPLEVVPSESCTVLSGSAVPETVKELPTRPPSGGLLMTGAAGAVVSTVQSQ